MNTLARLNRALVNRRYTRRLLALRTEAVGWDYQQDQDSSLTKLIFGLACIDVGAVAGLVVSRMILR
jgi:hypothetical protein